MKLHFIIALIALAVVSSNTLHFMSDEDRLSVDPQDWIGIVDKVLDLAKKAIDIIKSYKNSELKETLLGRGYEYFKGKCQISGLNNLREDKYPQYVEMILKRFDVDQKDKEIFRDSLESILFTDEQGKAVEKIYEIIYDSNTQDKDHVNSFTFIASRNPEKPDTFNTLLVDMKADFKLAPDLLLMHEEASYVGGIWAEKKDHYIKRPVTLGEEELKFILSFFELMGLKSLGDELGIKVPSYDE